MSMGMSFTTSSHNHSAAVYDGDGTRTSASHLWFESERKMQLAVNISLMEFEAAHERNFAPLLPTIRAFLELHHLNLSHSFDLDPLGTHACYFCSWPPLDGKPQHRYICICVLDPWEPGADFNIDAEGKRFSHQHWHYSLDEGERRLNDILIEAKFVLDSQ